MTQIALLITVNGQAEARDAWHKAREVGLVVPGSITNFDNTMYGFCLNADPASKVGMSMLGQFRAWLRGHLEYHWAEVSYAKPNHLAQVVSSSHTYDNLDAELVDIDHRIEQIGKRMADVLELKKGRTAQDLYLKHLEGCHACNYDVDNCNTCNADQDQVKGMDHSCNCAVGYREGRGGYGVGLSLAAGEEHKRAQLAVQVPQLAVVPPDPISSHLAVGQDIAFMIEAIASITDESNAHGQCYQLQLKPRFLAAVRRIVCLDQSEMLRQAGTFLLTFNARVLQVVPVGGRVRYEVQLDLRDYTSTDLRRVWIFDDEILACPARGA